MVSRKVYALYLLLCLGFLVHAGCEKTTDNKEQSKTFEIDKEYHRGPLTVHVRADKAAITIADTFLLELQAGIEPGFEVEMPQVGEKLENFGIVDWDNLGNKLGENNNIITTYRYKLEPFLSGTYALPAFTFEFYDVNSPQNNKYELTTGPVEIEVASLLGEQKAQLKIAALEGVVNMPAEPFRLWVWLLSAAAVCGGIIFWFKKRARRAKELVRIFKPAHQIAYERLGALEKEGLLEAGKIKEFYERISDVLRHYIEHRFNLRAPERTTEEFLEESRSANVFTQRDQQQLGEFLRHCDLVKFAKYEPTAEQIQQTLRLVKDFIETTKSDEKKIDVTGIESEQLIETVGA
jgi:hypothetical protein